MTYVATNFVQRLPRSIVTILGMGLVVSTLGGCGAGISLSSIGSVIGSSSSNEQAQQTQPVQQAAVKVTIPPIAFAPVFGPPVKVAKQISGALESESQVRSISVVKDKSVQPGYTVRGYLSASPDRNGTKLAYIWDIIDTSGKRAHRIKGEEIVPGQQNSKDPWALIDQTAIQAIAAKTATRLASWLPSGGVDATGSSGGGLVQQASLSTSGGESESSSRQVVAVIPTVQGAPGDGSESLAEALRKHLSGQGIKVASVGSVSNPYQVVGIVNLTSAGGSQQNIKIEWIVKDPKNNNLGTVTQKNTIAAGSLDGNWGQTADAAASAAAQGIAKLLKN